MDTSKKVLLGLGFAVTALALCLPLSRHKTAARGPATKAEPALEKPSLLHAKCVGGDAKSCGTLLRNAAAFKLTPQHMEYYSRQIDRPRKK